MGEFTIFHWLVVAAIVIIFLFGKKIPPIINRKGGPPTHPIPATGSIETSRPPKTSEKPWQALIGYLRLRRPNRRPSL